VAESLIQNVGFNGFSYEDIARIVGIKKPSIHHHFATKAELVTVLTQRYTHRFREQLLHVEAGNRNPLERLRAYAQLFEATYATQQRLCLCGMLGAEIDTLPESINAEVKRFFKINLQWLTDIITTGQQQQLLKTMPAEEMAMLFIGALEGSMVVGRGMNSDHGPQKAAKTLLDCWTV
jgi:TetR/AcrR family transcriptional repressor of nem operon